MATNLQSRVKIKHKICELFPVLAKNNVTVIETLGDLIYDSQNKQLLTIRLIRYKKEFKFTNVYFTTLEVNDEVITNNFPAVDYNGLHELFNSLQIPARFYN